VLAPLFFGLLVVSSLSSLLSFLFSILFSLFSILFSISSILFSLSSISGLTYLSVLAGGRPKISDDVALFIVAGLGVYGGSPIKNIFPVTATILWTILCTLETQLTVDNEVDKEVFFGSFPR